MNGEIGKRSNSWKWLRLYTGMMLALFVPMALCLILSGKTFLWGSDAYLQQYTVLEYTGNVLRGLFSGEGFFMLEYSLGLGMDAIATLGYYGLTDPLQWLGALFEGRALEVYYHFLIFFYIYLAGMILASMEKVYRAGSCALRRTAFCALRAWRF